MKKIIISIGLLAFSLSLLQAQGIRKHYTELTEVERVAYVDALDELISNNVLTTFTNQHANAGGPIHGVEVFLPWHRQFLQNFEWLLQAEDDNVTIPYWDWTGDSDPPGVDSRSTTGPLWDNATVANLNWTDDLLDSYDASLGLGRTLGVFSSLPTSTQISNMVNVNHPGSFSTYRQELEARHGNPHVWVGGAMSNIMQSPSDPVFYLHHSMVDKLWQDWEEIGGNNSSFSGNTMPTFNVNPNSITDIRTMGVFYSDAAAELATLEQYSVTNNALAVEKFVYQFTVLAENDFTVPSGNEAEFRSCNRILMKDKFLAEAGSTFLARIDQDCDFNTAQLVDNDNSPDAANAKQEMRSSTTSTAFQIPTQEFANDLTDLNIYPNPVKDLLNIEVKLAEASTISISLYNSMGQRITAINEPSNGKGIYNYQLNVNDYPSGAYFIEVRTNSDRITKRLNIIK